MSAMPVNILDVIDPRAAGIAAQGAAAGADRAARQQALDQESLQRGVEAFTGAVLKLTEMKHEKELQREKIKAEKEIAGMHITATQEQARLMRAHEATQAALARHHEDFLSGLNVEKEGALIRFQTNIMDDALRRALIAGGYPPASVDAIVHGGAAVPSPAPRAVSNPSAPPPPATNLPSGFQSQLPPDLVSTLYGGGEE